MKRILTWTLAIAAQISSPVAAADISVNSTLLKIIETVEVPAQQAGALDKVNVREGTIVDRGELLAHIADKEMELELVAKKAEHAIAQREAENDVNIRFSKKSLEVSQAELQRALDAIANFPNAVTQTELDRLRLLAEKNRLEIEQSSEQQEIAKLTANLKEAEAAITGERLAKHKIVAPIEGMVVHVFRREGEWVDIADPVVKIVRIDRLRAEGFVRSDEAAIGLQDRAATVRVSLPGSDPLVVPGKVIFVDPEVDPVNGDVRVWVEIDNADLKLRPGLRVEMSISTDEMADDAKTPAAAEVSVEK
ncbi:HlyD family efflux transporter periplasmic adaptor subunit [Blastopirellula sp. JC732]|uniref:HlyD family efflux transporter periplasmic adaptor subunit n=1 Tax=Blastopirellula sediminis TaxID=2894196 RepID=A0A9X1MQP6_9BACT|nr:HlyD family efflux transporter periplasmic adaptor subunit [Blastopirellula sediminis]MCC9605724.1 HlyD family efflux transporter periplasmic adaptor subunit [Blastopirellula sediminis]MCC9630976.1 HlyD family efflux transporter periplasmic adaptor subunit [Blastopirellula sediminis]